MTAIHRFMTRTLVVSFVLFLQGCSSPLMFLTIAGDGEKDVSDNFERGHVVGKVYELSQDAHLICFSYSQWPSLYKRDILSGRRNSECIFNIVIPKGSRIKVCSVVVATNNGHELCKQRIFANLFDDRGENLVRLGSHQKIYSVNVTAMFNDTAQRPLENWIFHPCHNWIKEID